MHDPLDPAPLIRLHRQDVAAVTLGDDGVLEGGPHRAEQRLQLAHHAVAGDPEVAPDLVQLRAGVVADLAAGVDGVADLLLDPQQIRDTRAVDATSSSSSGWSTPPRCARCTTGRTSWAPARVRPGLSAGSRRASSVAACQRSTRKASGEGCRAIARSRPAENEVRAASISRIF